MVVYYCCSSLGRGNDGVVLHLIACVLGTASVVFFGVHLIAFVRVTASGYSVVFGVGPLTGKLRVVCFYF